ncbi:PREDICTED: RNA-binding protein Musashi homolog 2-like, partial [Amphimedon queenslandica]|uniref:RRM domain-containing protein n=1 Tax=Amphimedon queenslandica TaxID=400682 RepID=A0AAN0K1D9_AMPQE
IRRIFVGGLSSDTDEDDMKEFFEVFGPVEEVQLMYDKHTNRHRGFGFVTFEKVGPAAKVCSIQFHDLKKKRVEVKVAQTKEALAHQADKARAAVSYNQHNYAAGSPAAFNYSPTYPSFFPHYPMAYYGGYGYPSDHHLPSPPFYPSGYNGGPMPFFVRGAGGIPEHSPPLPLSSPDYLSDHFQGLAIISNPFMSPTGSPPHGFPVPPSSYLNGGNVVEGSYSPPTGLSPKDAANGSPVNGYTQVRWYM